MGSQWCIAVLAGLAVSLSSCGSNGIGNGSPSNGAGADGDCPPRVGRFGSFRDFVLVSLPPSSPRRVTRWLFFDRFEVTRRDWAAFAASDEGGAVRADDAVTNGDPALPVGFVDLRQARAFARWRFARLPTREEWLSVATGGGRYNFPWGNKAEARMANTAELGLGLPTLVGVFEAGRRGDGAYDLIGNVSEWSESVASSWCEPGDALAVPSSFLKSRDVTLRASGLAVWQVVPGVVPLAAIAAARPRYTPHDVFGADFQCAMWRLDESKRVVLDEPVLGGDRRDRTGVRIVATPAGLLQALLAADVVPNEAERKQVRRFLRRGRHLQVLREAWAEVLRAGDHDLGHPLAELLRAVLE